jgi:hypothetical protein
MDAHGSLALRHLEVVMHVNEVGKRRSWNAVREKRDACSDGT